MKLVVGDLNAGWLALLAQVQAEQARSCKRRLPRREIRPQQRPQTKGAGGFGSDPSARRLRDLAVSFGFEPATMIHVLLNEVPGEIHEAVLALLDGGPAEAEALLVLAEDSDEDGSEDLMVTLVEGWGQDPALIREARSISSLLP